MSGRKRQPSKLISIAQIYQGRMKDMGDQKYFMMQDEPIHKVRLYGIVVGRYDGVSKSNREFTSLTIDDGTDTINITVWSRPIIEDDKVVYNPIDQVEEVKVGDVIDVLGRVREYEGEFFISPNSTKVVNDIDWEIHRRTQLVQEELQDKNLLPEEKTIFEDQPSQERQKDHQEVPPEPVSSEDLQEKVLQAMTNDFEENTVENLSEKLSLPQEKLQDVLNELMMLGEVFERLPGKFQKIDSPIPG